MDSIYQMSRFKAVYAEFLALHKGKPVLNSKRLECVALIKVVSLSATGAGVKRRQGRPRLDLSSGFEIVDVVWTPKFVRRSLDFFVLVSPLADSLWMILPKTGSRTSSAAIVTKCVTSSIFGGLDLLLIILCTSRSHLALRCYGLCCLTR